MKKFVIFFVFVFSVMVHADLLDRMKLEESFKTRIEEAFRIYDPEARVVLRFDYKKFNSNLPGITQDLTPEEVAPRSIEPSDIARLSVEVYTKIPTVNEDIKSYILKTIPLEKNKISIEYKKLAPLTEKLTPTPLDPKSFADILRTVIDSFTKSLAIGFAVLFVIGLGIVYQRDSRKIKEFKNQVQVISAAMAERSGPSGPLPGAITETSARGASANEPGDSEELKNLDLRFLKELFADCYWCEEDAYAHWLWKNIASNQKTSLLAQLPMMKDYSLYFVDIKPAQLSYHEHPYYLDPMGLLNTSQQDLSQQIRSDNSLWHFLSPMRQQTLPLGLEERLNAIQTKPDGKRPQISDKIQSPLRVLEAKHSWGEISVEDEKILYSNPEMVPLAMRENIHSLVWLAQKDDTFIQKALARFDARSLASAWVGPEEVLKKLETQLPEKKLKLLLTYKEKMLPTRNSNIYLSLVAEGLRNEAA